MVMPIICTHSQWSQGESCRWNGSWFRDVFPPVLFNVRFSHFPHLRNKNVKQQSQRQRKDQPRHQCMTSGSPEEKLLGGMCCMGGAEPERQIEQGLGKSTWRELIRDGKGYSSKGTRWRDSRQKYFLLSCYQANALCARVGRESLPLATKPLDCEEHWAAKQQLAWTKKKGSRQSYAQAKSQHSPSVPQAACELLQCLGPWSDPLSRACNETLGKH